VCGGHPLKAFETIRCCPEINTYQSRTLDGIASPKALFIWCVWPYLNDPFSSGPSHYFKRGYGAAPYSFLKFRKGLKNIFSLDITTIKISFL